MCLCRLHHTGLQLNTFYIHLGIQCMMNFFVVFDAYLLFTHDSVQWQLGVFCNLGFFWDLVWLLLFLVMELLL